MMLISLETERRKERKKEKRFFLSGRVRLPGETNDAEKLFISTHFRLSYFFASSLSRLSMASKTSLRLSESAGQ
jgi:hypothetical protein